MAKGVALAWDLIARDGASPTFNRVAVAADRAAASTRKAETGVAGFGKRAAAALGALATIDFAVHAVKDAAAFESAMNRIHTVIGASTDEVKKMSTAMLGLAGEVAQSPEHLAVSLYHMEAIGLRGATALDAVRVAAMGAKIGNADLEETTNALTATIQSGIAGNQSFAKTMSQLLTIVGTGDMKLQDFNEALGSGLLAVMANAGVSLRDVGAALAVFGDNNIRGADAATMLRVAVQAMQAPAKGGAKALASIGLSAHALKDDLLKGGLNAAITDLKKHLDNAGQGGKRAGALIVEAFGKKANTGIGVLIHEFGLLQTKYGIIDKNTNNFAEKWKSTTKTAAFALDRLRAEFEVVAITVGTKLIPAVTGVVNFLTKDIGPKLVGPWHALEEVLSVVGAAFSAVGTVLGGLHIPLGGIAIAALGAFAAFRVMGAIFARGGLLDGMALRLLYAKEAVVALGTSAVVAGDEVAAGGAVASIGWRGLLGPLAAAAVGIGLLVSMFHRSGNASKEAAAAAAAYTESLKGGKTDFVDSVVEQLAKNNVPQKINDLNKSLGSVRYSGKQFVDAIQHGGPALAALRAHLEDVIKSGTHMSVSVSKAGGSITGTISPAAKTATKLLKDLNAQVSGLSKAAQKDLTDTKAFAGVSASIDKVSQATQVGSDTAKKYAQMLGIVIDKNGIAAVSSKTLEAAVNTVSRAYSNATQTGDDFLKAFSTFSSSAGTAADRAALIGATLKAANGDALSFAGALTATTSAVNSMTDAFASQRQQLKDQSDAQAQAAKDVGKAQRESASSAAHLSAAEARLRQVRGNPKSTAAQIAAAEATVTSAQNTAANSADGLASAQKAAGKAGALAYRDTERAAIRFTGTGANLTATINTAAKGAGDLVTQLEGIQSAAMAAASAMFQHEKGTKGAKQAADDAYKIYMSKTQGVLIDEAAKLHLTKKQAKALADQYFGMPKKVKTLIEQEGANPVLDVLTKIGKLLANFTGQPWDTKVKVTDYATGKLNSIHDVLNNIPKWVTIHVGANNDVGKAVHDAVNDIPGHAKGGSVSDGYFTVGEQGPELGRKQGSKVEIFSNSHPKTKAALAGQSAKQGGGVYIAEQNLTVQYPLEGGLSEALKELSRMSARKIREASIAGRAV